MSTNYWVVKPLSLLLPPCCCMQCLHLEIVGADRHLQTTLRDAIALQISKTFKDQPVLNEVSWDVKRGERAGLVGMSSF